MKIFWYNIDIKKQDNNAGFTQQLVAKYPNLYLGNNIWNLWNYTVDRTTPFKILQKNVISSRAWKLISDRIGTQGFELVDKNGQTVEKEKAPEIYEKAEQLFTIPTFHNYIYESIGMIIWAWQRFTVLDKMSWTGKALKDSKVKILDSREITIDVDSYWNVISYQRAGMESFWPKTMVDLKIFKNLDNPVYGQSMLESVITDWLTDLATSDKLMHFFRNNAMPNIVFTLKEWAITNEEQRQDFETRINEKYAWVSNSSKPLVSNAIEDVKVVELSHKDLELLNQRLFIHNEFWITFWFDLRLLSYMRDWWSYTEIDSITLKQANSQLNVYASYVELWMKLDYEKFVWKIPYTFRLKNEYYRDVMKEKETALKELWLWAISRNEYRDSFNMTLASDEWMDDYILPNNFVNDVSNGWNQETEKKWA